MRFEEYLEKLEKELSKRGDFILQKYVKNNNCVRYGIIRKNKYISRVVYVDSYYNVVIDDKHIEKVADNIIELIESEQGDIDRSLIDDMKNFDGLNIIRVLINTDKNKERLVDIPHRDFMDLSITYRILFNPEGFGDATISITNDMMNYWNELGIKVNEETLYRMSDIDKQDIICNDMIELINSRMFENISEEEKELIDVIKTCEGSMYVITNEKFLFGASIITSDAGLDVIRNLFNDDCIIIPSSIREIIVIKNESDIEEIIKTIRCVNDSEETMNKEEILSYNAYRYLYKENRIEIA